MPLARRTTTRTFATFAVAFALRAAAGGAQAQDIAPDADKADRLVEVALRFRHDGKLDEAAAAFDIAIKTYPDVPARRQAQVEAHELAVVEGKHDRAARIARGWDLLREAVALAREKKADAALKLAREAKNLLVEGRVLHVLGRDDEALAALEKAGVPGALDRGELLLQKNRPADAAKAFEDAGDPLRRALALERCKDASASVVFAAARVEDQTRVDALRTQEKAAREKQAAAPAGLARERARFALADVEGELSDVCERLSIELERGGDKAKAGEQAQAAAGAAKAQREALTATGDKYGEALVRMRGLEAREKRLEERAKALKG